MSKIVLSAIKTYAPDKKIKKDDNGYYYVSFGAFNVHNENGDYYLRDDVEKFLKDTQYLISRQIKNGYLYGEYGHPEYKPGMRNDEYLQRNYLIKQDNISHHIRSVELIESDKPAAMGGKVLLVNAWIKPFGPKGEILRESLENPDINTAFSIRSIVNNQPMSNGRYLKKVIQIITWDMVIEPGVRRANKWHNLSNESLGNDLNSYEIDVTNLVANPTAQHGVRASMESSQAQGFDEMITIVKNQNACRILKEWK